MHAHSPARTLCHATPYHTQVMEDVAKAGKELAEELGLQKTADEMKEKSKELVELVKDITKGAVDFFVENAAMVSAAMKKANDTLGDKMNGMDQYVQCAQAKWGCLSRTYPCMCRHARYVNSYCPRSTRHGCMAAWRNTSTQHIMSRRHGVYSAIRSARLGNDERAWAGVGVQ